MPPSREPPKESAKREGAESEAERLHPTCQRPLLSRLEAKRVGFERRLPCSSKNRRTPHTSRLGLKPRERANCDGVSLTRLLCQTYAESQNTSHVGSKPSPEGATAREREAAEASPEAEDPDFATEGGATSKARASSSSPSTVCFPESEKAAAKEPTPQNAYSSTRVDTRTICLLSLPP